MKISAGEIRNRLAEKGLRVTPQRIAILEAIYTLDNHPSAEMIMKHIREAHPGISSATVYKVLDALEEKQLIRKVKTDRDIKRYDGFVAHHHHLYNNDTDEIRDYVNEDLDQMLKEFFSRNGIEGFEIDEIRLQIGGRFVGNGEQE